MHKYKTSPASERHYLGRTFGSKAEMQYCMMLERMLDEEIIRDYICQPKVWLGVPENVYVPDFLVIPDGFPPHYVDVKGVETQKFKRDKKLWSRYGRLPLHIVKRVKDAKFKTSEVINGINERGPDPSGV
jgi:hypothetical protein